MTTLKSRSLNSTGPISPRSAGCRVPLSDGQQTHWDLIKCLTNQRIPLTDRMRAAAVRVKGSLDVDVLKSSIEFVVSRHESLRTRIVVDGESLLRQQIDDSTGLAIEILDISADRQRSGEDFARHIGREFFEQRIDPCTDPLFATKILKLSDVDHVVLLALHHLVGDGVSCGILSREIWCAYDRLIQGLPPALPRLPIQFADFAVWQEKTYTARRDQHEKYWLQRAMGAPTTSLPIDFTEKTAPIGAIAHVAFGRSLSDGLRKLAKRERVLLPIVILPAFVTVMSDWCSRTELSFPFVSHGRHGNSQLQHMIGCLSQLLHFRISLSMNESLIDILKWAQLEFASAIEHQDFVPQLPPQCQLGLAFNWGGLVAYSARWSVKQQRSAASLLRIQPFTLGVERNIAFITAFSDTPAGIVATFRYRSDLVADSVVDRLGKNLRTIAEQFTRDPHARLRAVRFSKS